MSLFQAGSNQGHLSFKVEKVTPPTREESEYFWIVKFYYDVAKVQEEERPQQNNLLYWAPDAERVDFPSFMSVSM